MKLHITNIYGVDAREETVRAQKTMAEAGVSLGFREMGIYRYNVSSDSPNELSTRLDGIIAAVEQDDLVFLQLPTGNGIDFELALFWKIKAYGARVVLLVHDERSYEKAEGFHSADAVVCGSMPVLEKLHEKGLRVCFEEVRSMQPDDMPMLKQSLLLHAADRFLYDGQNKNMGGQSEDPALIHICFGLYDKTGSYSAYVGTTMQSVLEKTRRKVCFHILHDETLRNDNRFRLTETAARFGSMVVFHKINADQLSGDHEWVKWYTIGSMFRLLIPDILPNLKKVIYLDADIMFQRDIAELWDMNVDAYALAAVHDCGFEKGIRKPTIILDKSVEQKDYFNSGVLVMNLEKIRSRGRLVEMVSDFMKNYPSTFLPDQDALNYLFSKETLILDKSWNIFTKYERGRTKEMETAVYHRMGENYADFSNVTEFDKAYLKIRRSTPWGVEPVENEFYRALSFAYARVDLLYKLISETLHERKRVVFYGPYTMGMLNIAKLCRMGEGDFFVNSERPLASINGYPVRTFEELKNEPKGSYIVFVLPEADGGKGIENLEGIGLVKGKDYFVIPMVLTAGLGGYWL